MAPLGDRETTEARLLRAVEAVVLTDGFGALGVNAVARRAEVDKVLIYRYFGGLPGLLAAYAERGDFWWRAETLLADPWPAGDESQALAKGVRLVFDRHVAFLRAHPVTLEVLAWELADRNPVTEALEAVRESRSRDLLVGLAACFPNEPAGLVGRLAPAIALLGAAANYLAARARRLRLFVGIDLSTETGWAALAEAAGHMAAGAAAGPDAVASKEAKR